jgi:hypothetical protein
MRAGPRRAGALAPAACPLVQVDENDSVLIGSDEAERAMFHALFPAKLSRKQATMPTAVCPGVPGCWAAARHISAAEARRSLNSNSHLLTGGAGRSRWSWLRGVTDRW